MPSCRSIATLTYRHLLYTGILVYLVFCIVHIIWHTKLEYVLVIDTYSSILLILSLLYSKLLGYIFGWKESCVVICGSAEHWYIAKLWELILVSRDILYIKSHTNVVWSSFYSLATMERLASKHWTIVLLILLSEYHNLCLVTLLLTTCIIVYRLESRCSYHDSWLLNTRCIRSTRLIILSKISISFDIMTDIDIGMVLLLYVFYTTVQSYRFVLLDDCQSDFFFGSSRC